MPYKDRSAGLVIFGILTILLGCCCGGMAPFTLFSQTLVPADQKVGVGAILPALILYAFMGITMVALGIGSILARRWARALLLILSWSWLTIGTFEMIAMAFFMPKIMAHASDNIPAGRPVPSPEAMDIMLVVMFLFLAIFFILLPGIWTFFYYSPHVKATCEVRDPKPSWTDACPLPVLGMSLWVWLCVPMMLLLPFSGHLVMPLFGALLTGAPAVATCLVFAAVWGVAGWLLFRVDIRGWWLILFGFIAGSISSIVTFMQHDFIDIYRVGNYPQAQIDQIQKVGLFEGHTFVLVMAIGLVPFITYLIFIRRYFRR